MRFYRIPQALRLLTAALFSILLVSCGQGDGPEEVVDPLFAECKGCPIGGPIGGPPAASGLPVDFEDAGGPYTFGDFGGGATSIIDNPDMTGNPSAKVVQHQKFMDQTFGGTTVTLDGPIDFSSSEVITMKVWSSRVADVTLKIEDGGDTTSIVPTTAPGGGGWETLTFDFTGRTSAGITAVSIFFDNGILGDAAGNPNDWTFYLDDIEILGAPPPPPPPPPAAGLPVDFEDAGGPYTFGDFGGGATSIIDNPDMTGNPSAKVAQHQKFMDQTFGGTTLTLDGPIDFSSSEIITMKVWSSRVADVTFKIEDGGDTTSIVPTTAPGGGGWETLTFDFTGRTSAGITAVSIFFDNGTLGDAGGDPNNWTFYLDDIELGTAPPPPAGGELLTNGTFETGDTSGWSLVANNGTFTATMDQAASGAWSGNLVASVPGGGGPASFPVASQNNFAMGTVTSGQSVTVSFDMCGEITGAGGVVQTALLSEMAGGGASATDALFGNITPTDTWVNYTMTTLSGPDVSGGLSLQLKSDCGGNPGCTVNAYFDNVSVVLDSDVGNPSNAGGACPAAPPPPAPDGLPVDFEDAGGPYTFGDFGGGATSIIDNPDMTGNPSAKVAQHQKFMDQTFGGTTLTLDGPIDFSSSEIITMKVWSNRVAAVTFKIEDGGDTTSIVNTAGTGWETLSFDFTGRTSAGITAVSIFFDNGTLGDAAGNPGFWTFYLDDIQLSTPPPPVVALPVDFEDAGGPYTFGDFGGGATSIIDNPDMTGNPSAKVAQHQKFMDQTFGGTTLTLDGPIDFSSSEIITMKVWSNRVAAVTFKIEDGGDTTSIVNTAGTGWETLSFDFTGRTSAGITAVSIFFDNGTLGDAAGNPGFWTFYLDDIQLGMAPPPPSGGNLATNGDVEAGDLSGWDLFPSTSGVQEASTSNPNNGTYSARIQNTQPGSASIIKQANLGVGTVSAGQTVYITFSARGSLVDGGVAFAEFFCELTGGGTDCAQILGNAPLGLDPNPDVWTDFSFTYDIAPGTDVSGGITLQLTATTGGAGTSLADVYYDDICIATTMGVCP